MAPRAPRGADDFGDFVIQGCESPNTNGSYMKFCPLRRTRRGRQHVLARKTHDALVQNKLKRAAVDEHFDRFLALARDEPETSRRDESNDTFATDEIGRARVTHDFEHATV